MGGAFNQRFNRESLPIANGNPPQPKKKWSNLMPLFVLLVVVAEITFLGRLDMAKNSAVVDSWADLFHRSPATMELALGGGDDLPLGIEVGNRSSEPGAGSCEEWLEREDRVVYSRDFNKDPIRVSGAEKVSLSLRSYSLLLPYIEDAGLFNEMKILYKIFCLLSTTTMTLSTL